MSSMTTIINLVSIDLSPQFLIVLPCVLSDVEVTSVSLLVSYMTPFKRPQEETSQPKLYKTCKFFMQGYYKRGWKYRFLHGKQNCKKMSVNCKSLTTGQGESHAWAQSLAAHVTLAED